MIEPDWMNATEEEVWKYVAFHLSKKGIDTVLVGGSVVSVYSSSIFRSGDLDLVNINYQNQDYIGRALKELGFIRKGRHYVHPECQHIFIEFVPPPLSIGRDYYIAPSEVSVAKTVIRILSPTDCIKDRLASYIYFNARECLDQALLVALKKPFNLEEVKEWCNNEGEEAIEAYNDFLRILKKSYQ